jgi:predicted transcriptional regulator
MNRIEYAQHLKRKLQEAGISQTKIALYTGYYMSRVNSVLNGHQYNRKIISAVEEVLADPTLVEPENLPDRSHPLKKQLKEMGISQWEFAKRVGRPANTINLALQGIHKMPKAVEEAGEKLVGVVKVKARRGEV